MFGCSLSDKGGEGKKGSRVQAIDKDKVREKKGGGREREESKIEDPKDGSIVLT